MQVREGMSEVVLTVGPEAHTARGGGDDDREGDRRGAGHRRRDPVPGIVTERDILISLGRGEDPDAERVAGHMSDAVIAASPDWSLERAAAEMSRRGIRHLVVSTARELIGVLSMRDIVRVWTTRGRYIGDDARARPDLIR